MRALVICLAVLAAPALAQEQQRGYMGIYPAELSPEVRTAHKVDAGIKQGLVLVKIFEGTAAAKAGLRPGDVLTAFNNKPVRSIADLMELVSATKPGQRVAYVARRGSGTIAGLLVLGTAPAEGEARREVIIEDVTRKLDTPPKRNAGGEDELDARMDKLKREIEAMRAKAERRKVEAEKAAAGNRDRAKPRRRTPSPQNIVGWMELEELRIVAAKKAGNERAVQWHMARMQLLRELRKAGYNTPNAGKPNAGKQANRNRQRAEERMAKLEAQLTEVLKRLERIERRR